MKWNQSLTVREIQVNILYWLNFVSANNITSFKFNLKICSSLTDGHLCWRSLFSLSQTCVTSSSSSAWSSTKSICLSEKLRFPDENMAFQNWELAWSILLIFLEAWENELENLCRHIGCFHLKAYTSGLSFFLKKSLSSITPSSMSRSHSPVKSCSSLSPETFSVITLMLSELRILHMVEIDSRSLPLKILFPSILLINVDFPALVSPETTYPWSDFCKSQILFERTLG